VTKRILFVAIYEAIVLLQRLLPRLRGEAPIKAVLASARGRFALRILTLTVAFMAIAGGMALALVGDDLLFPYLQIALTMFPPLVGGFFLIWLMRQARVLETPHPVRTVELSVKSQRIPATVWLAAPPPLITAALTWWLEAHWNGLVVRDRAPSTNPLWEQPAFHGMVSILVLQQVLAACCALVGVAIWYGMARQYAFRKAQLHLLIALDWSSTLLTIAYTLPLFLQLPSIAIVFCAVIGLGGIALIGVFGPRARREWLAADMPASSYGWYFDRHDPSAFGERGTNLGNPWNWALFGAPMLFIALPFLLR